MTAEASHPKILVVDDETDICSALAKILEREDFVVETAESAEQALIMASKCRYDLVLSDLRLPGSDGLGLTQQLRKQYPGTKVILTTALADLDSYQKALNGEAIEYLIKPLKKEQVVLAVRRALSLESGSHGRL